MENIGAARVATTSPLIDASEPEGVATLRNGTRVRIRAIRPDDDVRLQALFARLSFDTVYQGPVEAPQCSQSSFGRTWSVNRTKL
jgi:hypothetical protein